MTEIEKIQSKILMRMQEILDNEQLQKLENVLVLEFHNIEVKQECTDLVTVLLSDVSRNKENIYELLRHD